jgi:hypothetical protein
MIVKKLLFDPVSTGNVIPVYVDDSAPVSLGWQLPIATIFQDNKKRKWLVKSMGFGKTGYVFGDWTTHDGDEFQYIVADQIETEEFARYAIERNTMNMLVMEKKLTLLRML